MINTLLWILLLIVCWPAAFLLAILLPFLWLLSIPFRIVAVMLEGVLAFVRALFMLPARIVDRL